MGNGDKIRPMLYLAPDVRWSTLQWQPMPPPQNTWVMLGSEGTEGEEQICSGYIHGERSWASTSYDGTPQASLNDHVPLSIFDRWAPIVTPAPPAISAGPVRCCPFCGGIENLEAEGGDDKPCRGMVEWHCFSVICNGREFWV